MSDLGKRSNRRFVAILLPWKDRVLRFLRAVGESKTVSKRPGPVNGSSKSQSKIGSFQCTQCPAARTIRHSKLGLVESRRTRAKASGLRWVCGPVILSVRMLSPQLLRRLDTVSSSKSWLINIIVRIAQFNTGIELGAGCLDGSDSCGQPVSSSNSTVSSEFQRVNSWETIS
jgi:hypothetical protein